MGNLGNKVRSRRLWLAILLLAAPAAGTLYWWLFMDGEEVNVLAGASAVAFAFLLVLLLLTEAVGRSNPNNVRKRYGYLDVVIGADGYASTSKAVVWLWTLVFAAALMFLSAVTWFSDLDAEKAFGSDWSAYLLLLGGPFAAAVLAKGITVGKASTQSGGTTEAASTGALATGQPVTTSPGVSDLGKNSSGDTSLPDMQYVIFSLLAIAYFIGALIKNLNLYAAGGNDIALPPIPEALLGLTSLAAATYVGAKAVSRSGLRLVQILPSTIAHGTNVTVKVCIVNASEPLARGMVSVLFTSSSGTAAGPVAPTTDPVRAGAVTSFDVEVPGTADTYTMVVVTPDGSTSPGTIVVS